MIDGIINGENDHEGIIEAIPKWVTRSGIHDMGYKQSRIQTTSHQVPNNSNYASIADELTKLGKLKEQGITTEEEFVKLKRDLLDGKPSIQ